MDTHLLSYIAGFLDGEGCMRWDRGQPRIEVSHTYPHVLEELCMALGGSIHKKREEAGRRPMFSWSVSGRRALLALIKLGPHLKEKRNQALLLQLMCDIRDEEYRDALDQALRALKRIHYKTKPQENATNASAD